MGENPGNPYGCGGYVNALAEKRFVYTRSFFWTFYNHPYWASNGSLNPSGYSYAADYIIGCIGHEFGHAFGNHHTFTADGCTIAPYNDPPVGAQNAGDNNMMNYGSWQAFTPCQIGLMHYNLISGAEHPWYPGYGHLDDIVVNDYCATPPSQAVIVAANTTAVWEGARNLRGDVYVESGATLTIKCRTGFPATTTKLVIRQGGKVIIDQGGLSTGRTGYSACTAPTTLLVGGNPSLGSDADNTGLLEIINSDVALYPNLTLQLARGASLHIASTARIAFNQAHLRTDAGSYLCVDPQAQLTFTNGSTSFIDPETHLFVNPVIPNPPTNCLSSVCSFAGSTISAGNPQTVCLNSDPIRLSAYPGGGAWSGPGIADPEVGVFTPASAGQGSHLLTYTACGRTATVLITVNANCCPEIKYAQGPDGKYQNPYDPSGNTDYVIGKSGRLTQLSGDFIFDGTYHVQGNTEFTPGSTVKILPGTSFYVEGLSGMKETPCDDYAAADRTFIRLDGAKLEGKNVTFAAACDQMWGGIQLNNSAELRLSGNTRYVGNGSFITDRNSIRNAILGIYSFQRQAGTCQSNNTNFYSLDYVDFFNNKLGLFDVSKASGQAGEGVLRSVFSTDPVVMKNPYRYQDSYNKFYATQGIKLYPFFDVSNTIFGNYTNVRFTLNTFKDLLYGFEGYGSDLTFEHNRVENCWYAGARIGGTSSASATGYDNVIILPSAYDNTIQIDPSVDALGVYLEGNVALSDNDFRGNSSALRKQVGAVAYSNYAPITIERNTFSNTFDGIQTVLDNSGTAHPIQGNKFSGNRNAIVVLPDYYATLKNLDVRCNTIQNPFNRPNTVGINVLDMAYLGDVGTPSTPNGNKFSGISAPVQNDGGIPFTYYRYASAEEDFSAIGITGASLGTLVNTGVSGINACGGPGNNGVNQRLSNSLGNAFISAIMDSIMGGRVPFARVKQYHTLVAEYHAKNSLMPKLESFVARLPLKDKESFNTLGLRLLDYYTQTKQPGRVQAVKALLLARSGQDLEVRYSIQLSEILGRTGSQPLLGSRIGLSDKTALVTIATSTTSRAPLACLMLRARAVPCACTVTPLRPNTAAGASYSNRASTSPSEPVNVLGQAYPNPAHSQATIAYELPVQTAAAELVIRDIATGSVRQRQQLSNDVVRGQAIVALDALSQGVYIYSLEVNGKRLATKKLVVIH